MEKSRVFPREVKGMGSHTDLSESGLLKREHYASMAMQGISSGYAHTHINSYIAESIAIESVRLADALIEELNKTKDEAQTT